MVFRKKVLRPISLKQTNEEPCLSFEFVRHLKLLYQFKFWKRKNDVVEYQEKREKRGDRSFFQNSFSLTGHRCPPWPGGGVSSTWFHKIHDKHTPWTCWCVCFEGMLPRVDLRTWKVVVDTVRFCQHDWSCEDHMRTVKFVLVCTTWLSLP